MLVSLDIETRSTTDDKDDALYPHLSEITIIGLWCPEFEATWTCLEDFNQFVKENPQLRYLGHNFQFDLKHLFHHGIVIPLEQWEHDTSLMAACSVTKIPDFWLEEYSAQREVINKALPKGVSHRAAGKKSLKTLAPYFLGVPAFWENPADHASEEYVLKDCEYTYKLWALFESLMKKEDTYAFYKDWLFPKAKMFQEAIHRGIKIDLAQLKVDQQTALIERERLAAQINNHWADAFDAYYKNEQEKLKKKYEALLMRQIPKTKNIEKAKQRYAKLEAEACKKIEPLNLSSPAQLLWLFRDYFQYDVRDFKGKESTGKEVLSRLAEQHDDVNTFIQFRKCEKLISSFYPTLTKLAHNETIHCSINVDGTRTGRTSCIEENQLIEIPGGRKKIKDIKEGDWVYCYDKVSLTPTLSKVKRVIDNGFQECINLKWQSSGNGKVGSLTCTPDHKILHKYKGWVAAHDLKRYDKLVHLKKAKQANGRIRIYGTNKYMETEQSVIKEVVFNAPSKTHIHHKNHLKDDNRIENLEILSVKNHLSYHAKAYHVTNPDHWKQMHKTRAVPKYLDQNPTWKHETKFGLLKKLAKAKGRPTYVNYDLETLKRKCSFYGVDLKAVCNRYSRNGTYLSPKVILDAYHKYQTANATSKALGIGTPRLKALCQNWGISYNHTCLSITPAGVKKVYDLEVEKHHNFIANEICVHNCSDPNLQQQPPSVRPLFIARPNYKLITLDESSIEPRLIAFITEDPILCELMIRGGDFHSANAIAMFSLDCTEAEVKDKHPAERKMAKELGLALLYGAGPQRIKQAAQKQGWNWPIEKCKEIFANFKDQYQKIYDFKNELDKRAKRHDVITNIFGRKHLYSNPDEVYMKTFNTLIQSSASDLLIEACLRAAKEYKDRALDAHLLLTVHDEAIVEAHEDVVEEAYKILKHQMTSFNLMTPFGNIPLGVEGGISNKWEK